jgi:nucleoside triphosphate pyrophosphatase
VVPGAERLVLASRSPQRRAILEQLGIPFDVVPADVDEDTEGDPTDVVTRNALRKARAVAGGAVLGVDTEVYLDGRLFGKPHDAEQARAFLEQLSGRTHEVYSGMALLQNGAELTGTARTSVTFRALEGPLIDWYLARGEWEGRAGGYAVQGRGAALIAGIDGDYWNVVGLPVALLLELAPWLVIP